VNYILIDFYDINTIWSLDRPEFSLVNLAKKFSVSCTLNLSIQFIHKYIIFESWTTSLISCNLYLVRIMVQWGPFIDGIWDWYLIVLIDFDRIFFFIESIINAMHVSTKHPSCCVCGLDVRLNYKRINNVYPILSL